MNSFETYILTFFIITLCIIVGLQFVCKGCDMNMLYWDYSPGRGGGEGKIFMIGAACLITITCLIVFYYGEDDYADDVNRLEHYYGWILGSTNVWAGLGYLLAYWYEKGYLNDPKLKFWWWFAFTCALACLIITCVYSIKLNTYIQQLTSKHNDDKSGDQAVWWVIRILSIIFVVYVCVFHTALWLYHRFHLRGNFKRTTKPSLDQPRPAIFKPRALGPAEDKNIYQFL